MKKVSYIPDGYNAVIPALAFHGADAAIKWYVNNLGAKEKMRFNSPDGTIAHAEVTIGDDVIMLAEENLQYNRSPQTLKGNSINLCIYVQDVDAVVKKATSNGAKLLMPIKDEFYGDRSGRIEDPFGYVWVIATHIKDVSQAEMKKAMDEMMEHQHTA
ncbi:MAG TPA: VOC family protein [Chitinophagaceae bacterium]|jgi:PhnB protein|nr:VOC family protein [Chitinophagaceae bacterium]